MSRARSGERLTNARGSRCWSQARNSRDGDDMTTRRHVLKLLGGGIAACTCAAAGLPSAAFADIPGSRRLVVVLQRGAMDGLAAVAPLGDPDYAPLRGNLALKPPGEPDGALALTRDFALHPSLASIHP